MTHGGRLITARYGCLKPCEQTKGKFFERDPTIAQGVQQQRSNLAFRVAAKHAIANSVLDQLSQPLPPHVIDFLQSDVKMPQVLNRRSARGRRLRDAKCRDLLLFHQDELDPGDAVTCGGQSEGDRVDVGLIVRWTSPEGERAVAHRQIGLHCMFKRNVAWSVRPILPVANRDVARKEHRLACDVRHYCIEVFAKPKLRFVMLAEHGEQGRVFPFFGRLNCGIAEQNIARSEALPQQFLAPIG